MLQPGVTSIFKKYACSWTGVREMRLNSCCKEDVASELVALN